MRGERREAGSERFVGIGCGERREAGSERFVGIGCGERREAGLNVFAEAFGEPSPGIDIGALICLNVPVFRHCSPAEKLS
jgi:hypothetical protein